MRTAQNQCSGSHHASILNDCTVKDSRAHAHKTMVADLGCMDGCIVAQDDIITNDDFAILAFRDMDDNAILNADPAAYSDRIVIASDDCTVPE